MVINADQIDTLINAEFPFSRDYLFLNHAAVSPWPKRTAEAIKSFADENVLTGPVHYPRWQTVEQGLREQLAELINAPSADDIALLKNTSEGLSVIAYGLEWQAGDNIIISDQEFPSNQIVWASLEDQGVALREAAILNDPAGPEAALEAACDANTRLMAISSVQYASGLALDLARLGRFCHAHNILFCIDGIQSIGALQMDVQAVGADVVVADGHKWLMAPEGLALFYCRPALRERLRLRQFGWHMVENPGDFDQRDWQPAASARRFECGSPNMLGIHGLTASLSLIRQIGLPLIEQRVCAHGDYLATHLQAMEKIEVIARQWRRGGIVSFRHAAISSESLYQHLLKHRLICALRGGAIRFSPHFYMHQSQLDRALEVVEESIHEEV